MKKILNKLLCKIFDHVFYFATQDAEKVKCKRCGEWFENDDAYGMWI